MDRNSFYRPSSEDAPTAEDIHEIDKRLQELNFQSVMHTQDIIDKKHLYTEQHFQMMIDLRNFQQEVHGYLNDLRNAFPKLSPSAEKIQRHLDEVINSFHDYVREVGKTMNTSNRIRVETHPMMMTAPPFEELVQDKIEVLRSRLVMLKNNRQELERATN